MSENVVLPPSTNRGAEKQPSEVLGHIGIDWLEFSVKGVRVLTVEQVVGGDDTWIGLDHGVLGYANGQFSERGAEVLFDARRPEIHVRMKGSVCARHGNEDLERIVRWVLGHGGHFSRVDIQATVGYEVARVEDFTAAVDRGSLVSHASSIATTRGQIHRGGGRVEEAGATLYVGAASARRRLRVYDKGTESGGEIPGTRIELQERDEAADAAMMQLVQSLDGVGGVFAGRLVSYIDFRDGPRTRVTNRERARWFSILVGEVQRLDAYGPEPPRSVHEVAADLRRQWAPWIATLEALGLLDMTAVVEEGRNRWRGKHRAALIEGAS